MKESNLDLIEVVKSISESIKHLSVTLNIHTEQISSLQTEIEYLKQYIKNIEKWS